MRKKKVSIRFVAGASALCVSAALAAAGPAGAQSVPGVGTSEASHTVLSIGVGEAGSLVDLGVLVDVAKSTTDGAVGPSRGFSRLQPLSVTSSVLGGVNDITAELPAFESSTPGGEPSVKGEAVDLGRPGGNALPPGLLSGSLVPALLTSALDDAGARSALESALTNVSALSGLLTLDRVSSRMSTAANRADAAATRSVEIGAVSLLDLGDLLKALNLDLAKLPLSVISELVKALNLPVALPQGSGNLATAVDTLADAIDSASALVAGNNAVSTRTVRDVPDALGVVGALPATLPAASGTTLVATSSLALDTVTVQALITTLRATLTNLLANALRALDGQALLELGGATVSAATTAADTLANSSANVTASIAGLSVLGLDLPGVDLLAVGNTVNSVTSRLTDVLGIIDPSLRGLVRVTVLDKTTSVTSANGYNNAVAAIDVLSVTLEPPPLLSRVVSALTGNVGLSSLGILSAAGVANPLAPLPVLGGDALALGNLLGLPAAVGALTEGLSLKVGSVKSASQFRLASAPSAVAAPVGDTLPRTGGDTRTLGMLAVGMAVLAVGVRRWARRADMGREER